jgi:hypothetical protein
MHAAPAACDSQWRARTGLAALLCFLAPPPPPPPRPPPPPCTSAARCAFTRARAHQASSLPWTRAPRCQQPLTPGTWPPRAPSWQHSHAPAAAVPPAAAAAAAARRRRWTWMPGCRPRSAQSTSRLWACWHRGWTRPRSTPPGWRGAASGSSDGCVRACGGVVWICRGGQMRCAALKALMLQQAMHVHALPRVSVCCRCAPPPSPRHTHTHTTNIKTQAAYSGSLPFPLNYIVPWSQRSEMGRVLGHIDGFKVGRRSRGGVWRQRGASQPLS